MYEYATPGDWRDMLNAMRDITLKFQTDGAGKETKRMSSQFLSMILDSLYFLPAPQEPLSEEQEEGIIHVGLIATRRFGDYLGKKIGTVALERIQEDLNRYITMNGDPYNL